MINIHRFSNLFLKITLISISCFIHTCHGACNPLDRDSLSSFNLSLSSSPRLDWSLSVDCCKWEGITCDGRSGRVTNLWLPSRGLVGSISPSILNLTSLTQLSLSHNSLSGPLPARLFKSLSQLQVIDLSRNRLIGELNSSDTLPAEARIFNFSSNHFHGPIQTPFIETGVSLETFDINNNSFAGTIPSVICSFSPSIKLLDFSNNDFTGLIPPGFGQCTNLLSLRAGFNNLSGSVPQDIYGLLPLEELYLPGNRLAGPIDPSLPNLINLKSLALFGNELTGPIPEEIGNLFKLEQLQLHINHLNGTIPNSLSNCTNLTLLNLRVNLLGGELSSLNFSRFVQLKTVDFGNNFFTGNLPRTLFLCKTLTAVRFATNKLSALSNNTLTNVTSAIRILSGCKNLRTLILAKNFYDEAFPDDERLVGFQNIQMLGLGGCNFTGQIPMWLSELNKLEVIDLSYNFLTGFVPGWFGDLPNLFYLDLSYNLLTGNFPMEFSKIRLLSSKSNSDEVKNSNLELPVLVKPDNISNLMYNQLSYLPPSIFLSNNSISGPIPAEIGRLKYIIALDLSKNNFSGEIPDTISNLTNLERLDLSRNDLTGEIPVSLQNLNFLSTFSVADNDLEGPIPTGGQFGTFLSSSFEGNPRLCGRILQRSCSNTQSGNTNRSKMGNRHNRKKTIILTLVISSAIFTMILLLYLFFSRRKIIPKSEIDEKDLEAVSFNSSGVFPEHSKSRNMKDFTIADILKATDNFNQANIIGCGGFGLVFKATLSDGSKVAIKKLSGDTGLMEREFKAEVEALSTAQHKNIVTLQGYCLHDGYRLLIYSYMENGSLDYWLHERPNGPSGLNWPARLKIAQGASDGVAYMHETCEPHIVHRDLKSSNILLDRDFEAHVADFGLARLIMPYDTHVSTELVGTLGYIPPEYSQSWMATLRGDMYSFGVVMLELLTGKRPVEVFKARMSRDLVVWVQEMRNEGRGDEIFDPILRGKGFEDEMARVLDVACMCVRQNPLDRPTIKEVVDWLKNVGPKRQTT
ncbi:tyrosine-sulfated glycopeptide receptor 1 [Phtheirospermum japonicum]|uniref:non-specific serine/threonine protein kinase n=1 Tax=Phtheirospermum japonicum TaxID=374723 RepID=A0A830C5D7_9LAMI|nr:tyrosine-sulfated glycopeptide receptor 1 [Phtheirospermum japonicum]